MSFVQIQTTRAASNEDNIIPLINVVFLMLIFFMIAGVIRETDKSGITHPASNNNTRLAKHFLTLVVREDESIIFEKLVLSHESLAPKLKQILLTKQNISDLYLVLRVDRNLSAQALHKVLISIRKAGLLKVQLLTEYGETV